MNGKNLKIKIQGSVVALATSCEVTEEMSLAETSTLGSSYYKTYRADRIGWRISCNHLLATSNFHRLHMVMQSRTPVSVSYEYTEGQATHSKSGMAYITRISESGQVGNLATQAVDLVGTGELV